MSEEVLEDSYLLRDVLPPHLASEDVFNRLLSEVNWSEMLVKGGKVPRLVCLQGKKLSNNNAIPIYRVPTNMLLSLDPFNVLLEEMLETVEAKVGQHFNHCLLQLYRSGHDWISEHADKTLDIARGSVIVNLSLGAERVMKIRSKSDVQGEKVIQNISLQHNSLFVLGWNTNLHYLHSIKENKKDISIKSPSELLFGGKRISLTFRLISTFQRPDKYLYGQGGINKTEEELEEAVSSGEYHRGRDEGEQVNEMLIAFGKENHSSSFDWDENYGRGFNVLDININT